MNINTSKNIEAISNALPKAYKLINTILSKQFEKDLKTDWKRSKKSENVRAIQLKAQTNMKTGINRLVKSLGPNAPEELKLYLTWLQAKSGTKVLAMEKKGLIKTMDIKDYICISELIYASASYETHYEFQSNIGINQFELHQALHDIAEYMLIKNTVEYGTKNKVFDETANNLISNKPTSFFKGGILTDFFVVDQKCAFLNPEKNNKIVCMKEYLSTFILSDSVDKTNREVYQIS